MTRQAIVAGKFYEADKAALKKQINDCFMGNLGPNSLPLKKSDSEESKITAMIVPHAGYVFSGACAAHAYKELAKSQKPDIVLILGTDHSGAGTCLCDQDFETPLGIMKTDKDLLFHLQRKIPINNSSHSLEHSIEVQIPFLQFIYPDNPPKITALIIGEDWKNHELDITLILKQYKEMGKKILILVSSDFTHYGISYGYMPFNKNIRENLANLDKGAINQILKLDEKGFIDYMKKYKPTICGAYGIALLLTYLNNENLKPETSLLKYYTSGDITNDYSNAVGYAAILLR